MSSQSFLWIHVVFALSIAGLFVVGRSRIRAPTRLRLRQSLGSSGASFRQGSNTISPEIQKVSGDEGLGIKNLNVLFMYNGHSFDAHEVLGIPAGSRRQEVDMAYARALKSPHPQAREFLETAYRAIMSTF